MHFDHITPRALLSSTLAILGAVCVPAGIVRSIVLIHIIEQSPDDATSQKRDFAHVVELLWENADNVFWPKPTVKEQIRHALFAITEPHFVEHFPDFTRSC